MSPGPVTYKIGIDFDNTIAGYDALMTAAAREFDWLTGSGEMTKKDVRNALRQTENGEQKWQKLQAIIYGARMGEAVLLDGVREFLGCCRETGCEVFVVSHKTEFATLDPNGVNLRDAARCWLKDKGLIDNELSYLRSSNIFFEATRQEKVERVNELGCTHFIDDLAEVFEHPQFPVHVRRYLLSADSEVSTDGDTHVHGHWRDIMNDIFAQ